MRRNTRKKQGSPNNCITLLKLVAVACVIAFAIAFLTPISEIVDEEYVVSDGYSQRSVLEVESVTTPTDAERKAADKVMSNAASLPRYILFTNNMKLQRYPSAFCGGKDFNNCDTAHYIESIFLTSGIGFLVAAVSLLFGIVFWTFRCCAFGGCKASHGVFCPAEEFDESLGEGYYPRHVLLVKIAVVGSLLALVPFFVVGHVGNANLSVAVDSFTGTIMEAANRVVGDLEYINTTLSNITLPDTYGAAQPQQFQQQIQTAISKALTAGETVLDKGKLMQESTVKYNNIRDRIILAGLILPLAMVAVTAIAGVFNLAPLALITSVFGFIVLAYGWISFSVHYPLSLVVDDVCTTFDNNGLNQLFNYTSQPGNTTYNVSAASGDLLVNALLECGLQKDNNVNPFKPLLDVAQNGLTMAFDLVCDGFEQICNTTYQCPTDSTYTNLTTCKVMDCPDFACNSSTVEAYSRSNITDFNMGCLLNQYPPVLQCPFDFDTMDCPGKKVVCDPKPVPFDECPEKCRLKEARNLTQYVETGLTALQSYNDLLVNHIFPLLDCSFVAGILRGVDDAVCVTSLNALTYISAGEAGISCIFIAGLILSILGIKRFNTNNVLDNDKDEEMDQY